MTYSEPLTAVKNIVASVERFVFAEARESIELQQNLLLYKNKLSKIVRTTIFDANVM